LMGVLTTTAFVASIALSICSFQQYDTPRAHLPPPPIYFLTVIAS